MFDSSDCYCKTIGRLRQQQQQQQNRYGIYSSKNGKQQQQQQHHRYHHRCYYNNRYLWYIIIAVVCCCCIFVIIHTSHQFTNSSLLSSSTIQLQLQLYIQQQPKLTVHQTTSASIVRSSGNSVEEPITSIWQPYTLTQNEITTGQLSNSSIYSGAYQYSLLSNTNKTNHQFRIYFPSIDDDDDINHVATPLLDESLSKPTTIAAAATTVMKTATYLITHRGNKGDEYNLDPNQDRCIYIEYDGDHSIYGSKTSSSSSSSSSDNQHLSIAALFDGHGDLGHVTSHIAVTELPQLILQSILQSQLYNNDDKNNSNIDTIQKIIRDAIESIDTKTPIAQISRGGSTAIIVVRIGNIIHMASVGDSTALLIQWNITRSNAPTTTKSNGVTNSALPVQYSIVKSAVHHKPGHPKERERIEQNGGTVYIPRNDIYETSRVIYTSSDQYGNTVQTGLAMSRSLGDGDAKKLKVVISTPDILSYEISSSENYFIILASDGLMDVLSMNNDIIIPIGNVLYATTDTKTTTPSLSSVCRQIVQKAIRNWNDQTGNQYRDDISLVVHKIVYR